jgi:hypothetical protein
MMTKQEQLDMMLHEYELACVKHPKFCDILTNGSLVSIGQSLDMVRLQNAGPLTSGNVVLSEEILEALEAYKLGEYEHTIQELAQCGAVILRMMDFVIKEKLDETAKGS